MKKKTDKPEKTSPKRLIILINIALLIIIFLVLFYLSFNYFKESPIETQEECIDISYLIRLNNKLCFDSDAKNIQMLSLRGADNRKIEEIKLVFMDEIERKFIITDAPDYNELKTYEFNSTKNPQKIRIIIIPENPPPNLCSQEKTLPVKECEKEFNLSVTLTLQDSGNVPINVTLAESESIPESAVKKEQVWTPSCISSWQCGEWEECKDGRHARTCKDENNCNIPTNLPEFTRYCRACNENWQCDWSTCESGYTTPSCTDLNNCLTQYSVPKKISCEKTNCKPDINCGEWEECKPKFGVIDLSKNLQEIQGEKQRICRDRNNCISTTYETQTCSIKVNIYTKEINWYGEKYLEIYDKLTDKLLSRVKYSKKQSVLDLNFFFE